MAQTLTNFLIGIGFETSEFDKGEKKINAGLKGIKTGTLLASAALAGVGLAIGLATNAAGRIDKIALASQKFNTSASFVNNYGNALRMLGGDAAESIQAIDAAESALANFRIKGSFDQFNDPTLAGIDTNALTQAKNGEEFLRMLATQMPQLNKDQQRLIQENFGFSDATMASLRQGSQQFDALVAKAERLAPGFDKAVESARAYNQQLAEIQLQFQGIGNRLAETMLPALTGILGSIGNFIDEAKKSPVDATVGFLKKQFPVTSALLTGDKDKIQKAAKGAGSAGDWFGVSNKIPLGNIGNSIKSSMRKQRAEYERTGKVKTTDWSKNNYVESVTETIGAWRSKDRSAMHPEAKIRAQNGGKMPPIQNNINLKVELDGQAVESKITEVQTRRDNDTIDNVKSTTSR